MYRGASKVLLNRCLQFNNTQKGFAGGLHKNNIILYVQIKVGLLFIEAVIYCIPIIGPTGLNILRLTTQVIGLNLQRLFVQMIYYWGPLYTKTKFLQAVLIIDFKVELFSNS